MNDIENNYEKCEVCKSLFHVDEMTPVYTINDLQIWLCNECILHGDANVIIGMLRNEQ